MTGATVVEVDGEEPDTTVVVGATVVVAATVVVGADVVVGGRVVVVVDVVVVVVVVVGVGPEIWVIELLLADPTHTLLSTINVTTGREPTAGLVELIVPVFVSIIDTKFPLKLVAQMTSPSKLRLEMLLPP